MPVNVVTFFSEITPKDRIEEITAKLSSSGAYVIDPQKYDPSMKNSYFFIGSGGTENFVADFMKKLKQTQPITLLAHESSNSLPAAMEIRTYLQEEGIPARVMHAPLDNLLEKLEGWTRYAEILKNLEGAKVGLIGESSSWLIASDVDKKKVKDTWGVSIEQFTLSELVDGISDPSNMPLSFVDRFIEGAKGISVPKDDIQNAGRVTHVLIDLVNRYNLNAVTVQCFALFEQTEITGCMALSHLNDVENLVAGCEGDLPSTFTLMISKFLTKEPAFMANVVEVDEQANTVVLAHCTSPTEILSSYDITTHFETGQGVAVKGMFEEQEITVFKVFGKSLTDYWVSSGTIVENQYNECGCRTQVKVQLNEPVKYFLEDSLANHHVLLMGDHASEISEFFSFKLGEL
jgi:L-fucose isomerase-like protein